MSKIEKISCSCVLKFTETVLGSSPADPEIYSKFIGSKAPQPQDAEQETATIKNMDIEFDTKGITVFPRDDTGLFLYDYHIKGFLKEAGNNLKDAVGIKALRGKLDRFVFIRPRRIYLLRHGEPLTEADGTLERTIRAMTMQGERTALASSEKIDPPCELHFVVEIIENKVKIDAELLADLFNYGQYKGLGQWRNGSYGTFECNQAKQRHCPV